jgi:subtilisin family serine protease
MKRKIEKSHLGPEFRKAQPRLRVFTNGDSEVNERRAMQCGAVAVTDGAKVEARSVLLPPVAPTDSKQMRSKAIKGKQKRLPSDISVNVFIQSTDFYVPGSLSGSAKTIPDAVTKDGKTIETSRNGNLVTARVRMSDLPELLKSSKVTYVELAESLRAPRPVIATGDPAAPGRADRSLGNKNHHKFGEDVIIGIIDVGGFDFSHEDFLDEKGKTRFLGIWDQGGKSRPSPFDARINTMNPVPKTFDYGSEILAEHMDAAIKASTALGLPATELEPQSQMEPGSHGTHVASIAAGNLGVARKAKIAAVLLSIPPDETKSDHDERRGSFYDSTQIAHAVDYLMTLASGRPISINISLGTNGHAHDGSSPVSRWIDAWLTAPGSAVTVAAGNAGQEAAKTADDMGYIMGRIHTSGQIASRGLTADIEWQVIGNGDQDMSENEMEIWYSAQDHFSVQVRSPETGWTEEVEPRQFIENRQMPNRSLLSIYNERYHPANGLNCISIYLSPFMKGDVFVGSKAGMWKVRLRGIEVRDGRFHGWIERDDPRQIDLGGGKTVWFLPSFLSERSNVDNSSVSSLACGQRIISVANLDASNELINVTSSQGPTRDGRTKPDVAAPGTEIVAAKGFSPDDRKWISMSGTSMAAPYVTGIIGLMLGVNGGLTAAQIEGIIQSTAQPLPGGTYKWIDSAGFGRIDPEACLKQALAVNDRVEVKK